MKKVFKLSIQELFAKLIVNLSPIKTKWISLAFHINSNQYEFKVCFTKFGHILAALYLWKSIFVSFGGRWWTA